MASRWSGSPRHLSLSVLACLAACLVADEGAAEREGPLDETEIADFDSNVMVASDTVDSSGSKNGATEDGAILSTSPGLDEGLRKTGKASGFPTSPCGANLTAHIVLLDDDREVYFCTFGSGAEGVETILDVDHRGRAPRIRGFDCAIDVYNELLSSNIQGDAIEAIQPTTVDDVRVALLHSCDRTNPTRRLARGPDAGERMERVVPIVAEDPQGHRQVDSADHAPVLPNDLAASTDPQLVGTYCGASGQSNFAYGPCDDLWRVYYFPGSFDPATTSYYDCSSDPYNPPSSWQCNGFNQSAAPWQSTGYCRPTAITSHTRTATTQLGRTDLTPGSATAEAREFVASCSGSTQFQSYYRPSSGGSWVQTLDFAVAADTTATWVYSSSTAKDIQYLAASATGAYHRYVGGFSTNAP